MFAWYFTDVYRIIELEEPKGGENRMHNIVLICAGGMSSSLLVSKMQKYAQANGMDVNIIATGADEFAESPIPCDVLLMAPQITYELDEFKKKFGDQIKIIEPVSMKNYGMMAGDKVMEAVMEKL